MTRREFIQLLANDYYIDKEITMEELTSQVKALFPVFGEMKIEINKTSDENSIFFLDEDIVTHMYTPHRDSGEMIEVRLTDEESKRYSTTTRLLTICTDIDGVIRTTSCGINDLFTQANKDITFYAGYLIDKKLTGI